VRMERAALAENHMFADDGVGADDAIRADPGAGVDEGGGVDHSPSRSMRTKVTSASLTGSLSTRHVPLALPILPRDLVSSTSLMVTFLAAVILLPSILRTLSTIRKGNRCGRIFITARMSSVEPSAMSFSRSETEGLAEAFASSAGGGGVKVWMASSGFRMRVW